MGTMAYNFKNVSLIGKSLQEVDQGRSVHRARLRQGKGTVDNGSYGGFEPGY